MHFESILGRNKTKAETNDRNCNPKFVSQSHNKKGRHERGKRLVHPGREEGVSGNSWNCSAVSTFGCFAD